MDDREPTSRPARTVQLDEIVLGASDEVSWVESSAGNSAQLRFHDRVQGAVCLRPGWTGADGSTGPGSVLRSSYQALFPAAVLLGAAGDAGPAAAPRILVVGLGAGAGVVLLAHHWPAARIAVVEVDTRVVELALRHHPLLRRLSEEPAAGSASGPRLRILRQDVRELITATPLTAPADARHDAVILDAFTPHGGIPRELSTPAFFSGVADRLLAEGGTVLSNVPGSYSGPGAQAPARAVEGMAQAGLGESHNFPMPARSGGGGFHPADGRNNLIVSARHPLQLGPSGSGAARMAAFLPYPDVSAGSAVSEELILGRVAAAGPAWAAPLPRGALRTRLEVLLPAPAPAEATTTTRVGDGGLAEALAGDVAHRYAHRLPQEWRRQWTGEVSVIRTDHVVRVRELFSAVITEAARTGEDGSTLVHGGRRLTHGAGGGQDRSGRE